LQLDISPRVHQLTKTELVALPNSLAFAGAASRKVEIIDVHRHGAERNAAPPPPELPRLPASWSDRYERLAEEQELQTASFAAAVVLVAGVWTDMSFS